MPAKDQAIAVPESQAIDRFELPERVDPSVPERSLPFEEVYRSGAEIVILGIRGEEFNTQLGPVVRLVWQYADAWPEVGPDAEQAWESLVAATSIPAREGLRIDASKDYRLCKIEKKTSALNPGQSYYILV